MNTELFRNSKWSRKVLTLALVAAPFQWTMAANMPINLAHSVFSLQQQDKKVVKGHVVDENGEPLIGVTIAVITSPQSYLNVI